MPSLLSGIEAGPNEAKEQRKHGNDVREVPGDELSERSWTTGLRIYNSGRYRHLARSSLPVGPEQQSCDGWENPRNSEVCGPRQKRLIWIKVCPAVDANERRESDHHDDYSIDDRSAEASPEANVLEIVCIHLRKFMLGLTPKLSRAEGVGLND